MGQASTHASRSHRSHIEAPFKQSPGSAVCATTLQRVRFRLVLSGGKIRAVSAQSYVASLFSQANSKELSRQVSSRWFG